jgi:tetratricopeptide (TPR) repeat protein
MDYTRICFVIMPFGEKDVTDDKGNTQKVNFDKIYDNVFVPAVSQVKLPPPETGNLEPRRTDKDFFTGDISQEMFEYLEYSRFALTDITGLNANVFYELGVRHRARQAGTAIFRQVAAKLPFDIASIKAFFYEYQPDPQAAESRKTITQVLTESLQQNRIDSPVQRALIVQRAIAEQPGPRAMVEADILAAENAIRAGNKPAAITAYRQALVSDPKNNLLHLRLGLLLKDQGDFEDALQHFTKAVELAPEYSDAHREKGIAENKLWRSAKPEERAGEPDGIESLRAAIQYNPQDYDAHASLGGALKRSGKTQEALAEYERAVEVSQGHSYPLLNALKLKAQLKGKLEIDSKLRFQMKRAERSLQAQVSADPPLDPPWSFFDLAEIRLYNGDSAGFLATAERGTEFAANKSEVVTFREALEALSNAGVDQPGLKEGIAMLREREGFFDS